MNRSLKLSVLAALALGSAPALALNLGQIQVKSALDRPLVAEIPLHPDYPGEADHVEVTLAPAAAFASAGISRASLKVPLTFEVVTNAQGQKVIRVTSTQPVREPYLDFLIQVSWPKGKMLREYTVLLDPLSMSSAPGAVPAKAPPAPASQPAATEPARPPAPAAQAQDNVYGPVPHGDTLSHIARAHAIDGVSYQQMLIALKAFNPDAFFRDNVNALKTGAVLRIPTRAQALAVKRKDAIAAVRRQNQAWQARHAATPTLVAGAGDSSAPVNGSGRTASGNDRLHLVPPESGGASAGAAGGNGQASVSQLRQDLARSKEALSSQRQAAADLKSRVAALEQIADKNKRLLSLKNAEIAELQQKLAEARKAAGLPALPASALAPAGAGMAAASSVAGAAPATAASANAVALAAAASAGNTAAPVAAATAAHASAVATDAAAGNASQAEPSAAAHAAPASAPWYEQLWARVVLAIIIVLLIAWMVLRRRKPSGKAPKASLADHFGDSPLGHDAAASDGGEPAPAVDDDGEDELLAQLAEHPDNVGLHLELASLYYARRDAGQFEGAAEAMHAYVDDESQPEWQDVVAMGRDLAPDHPLFARAEEDVTEVAGAVDDLPPEEPLGAATPESGGETLHEVPPAEETVDTRDSDHSYDFDLAPQPSPVHEPVEPEPSAGMPDESEFDALPPLPGATEETSAPDDVTVMSQPVPDLTTAVAMDDPAADFADDGFSDDPVDTKLDLARAYMDMGDHDGARAMLTEALNEGSQMQKDTAQKLLDELD